MAELSPTESQLIGSRIREARVKRRMSQAELADKAGISLPQISTIENGRCSMKLHSFIRIIEALHSNKECLVLVRASCRAQYPPRERVIPHTEMIYRAAMPARYLIESEWPSESHILLPFCIKPPFRRAEIINLAKRL